MPVPFPGDQIEGPSVKHPLGPLEQAWPGKQWREQALCPESNAEHIKNMCQCEET